MRRLHAAAFQALEPRRLLSVEAVADVNQTTQDLLIGEIASVGGAVYASGSFGTSNSFGLRTTGAGAGLARMKRTSLNGVDNPSNFTDVGGTLFFTAYHLNYPGLWKSDGTAEGTVLLKDVPLFTLEPKIGGLTAMGGVCYFESFERESGRELWRSDGTPSGTYLLKDINPGYDGATARSAFPQPPGPNLDSPTPMVAIGSTLFFVATDGVRGRELWKTDGTAAGTVMVADINPGAASSSPSYLTAVGDLLYFFAGDPEHGMELWRTDGTAAGTTRVKDINPGADDAVLPAERSGGTVGGLFLDTATIDAGGTLYFFARTPAGRELWKSDGTEAGTARVAAASESTGASPGAFAYVGGTVYFVGGGGSAGALGRELWKTDGTEAGTVIVRDIRPGPNASAPSDLVGLDGILYFGANDGVTGRELWRSDGSAAGTYRVVDLNPLGDGLTLSTGLIGPLLVGAGGRLYFSGADLAHGRELFSSDGTAAGTAPVGDVNTTHNPGGYAIGATLSDGSLLMSASDGLAGAELWRSDESPAGGHMVADLRPGPRSSTPTNFHQVGSVVVFTAEDDAGNHLWRTDGTAAGTAMVADLKASTALLVGGNYLYFMRENVPAGSPSLWRTDGTPAGTVMLQAPAAGTATLGAFGAYYNGLFYFGAGPDGLWRTDGTPAGTRRFDSGPIALTYPGNFRVAGGTLFFGAADGTGTAPTHLCRTDGTAAGTVRVLDTSGAHARSSDDTTTYADHQLEFDGTLYYTYSSADRTFLNKVDPATGRVVTLGAFRFRGVEQLTAYNGRLYFLAAQATPSRRLWTTDGTPAGTVVATDVVNVSSVPADLTVAGGKLYFVGDELNGGTELWRTDGTAAGTRRVTNLEPGRASSTPAGLFASGDTLYFTASAPGAGRLLYRLPAERVPPVILDVAFDLSVRPTIRVRFSENVEGCLDVRRTVTIINRATGATVVPWIVEYDSATHTARFVLFSTTPSAPYRVVVNAGDVFDDVGNTASPVPPVDFFHLIGDANHDGQVNFTDLVAVSKHYNVTDGQRTWADGDFDGDGRVTFADLVLLAQRYDTSVAPPPPAIAAPPAPAAVAPVAPPKATAPKPVVAKPAPRALSAKPVAALKPFATVPIETRHV